MNNWDMELEDQEELVLHGRVFDGFRTFDDMLVGKANEGTIRSGLLNECIAVAVRSEETGNGYMAHLESEYMEAREFRDSLRNYWTMVADEEGLDPFEAAPETLFAYAAGNKMLEGDFDENPEILARNYGKRGLTQEFLEEKFPNTHEYKWGEVSGEPELILDTDDGVFSYR